MLTCITPLTKDLQSGLGGQRLRAGDHSYGPEVRTGCPRTGLGSTFRAVDNGPPARILLKRNIRLGDFIPVDTFRCECIFA